MTRRRCSRSSPRSTTRPSTSCATRSSRCSRQDFDDWELILVDDCSPNPAVREVLRELAAARPADPGHRARERPHRGGLQRRGRRRRGASSSRCSTTTTCWSRRACRAMAEAIEAARRRRLPLLRRGQGRRRGQLLRPVPQARLVARAAARPEVHLPLLGAAHRAGPRGRRLPRGVRRLAGPRPGAAGHRAGPPGRAHPRGALPLADDPGLGRRRRRRQAVRRDRRAGRPCRTTSTGSASTRDASTTARVPGLYVDLATLDPARRRLVVIPTERARSGLVWGVRRVFVVEAVRSLLAHTEHENLEVVVVYDAPTPARRAGRAPRDCRRPARAWSVTTSRSTSAGR